MNILKIKQTLILSALLFLSYGQAAAQSINYTKVTNIEEEGVPKPEMSVIVNGDHITAVASTDDIQVSEEATIIDRTKKSEFSEIDEYIRHTMDERHIPGLQVVITKNGEIAYTGNFGYADLSHNVPVTDSTRFRSGSIAKTATAIGVALLERDGLLSFNDPLTKFFPDAPAHWKDITVLDLLDQTSGLQDPELGWTQNFTADEYLKAAYALPPEYLPGKYHVYLNVNYALLGLITDRISGMSWQEFQHKRIFSPLKMSRTHSVTTLAVVSGAAEGYQWRQDRLLEAVPEFSQSQWDLADGSLWTTAHDWTRLLLSYKSEILFNKSFIEDELLNSRNLESGHLVNYSFGNWVGEINGNRTIEHGGGVPGFRTFAVLYPDKEMTIMVTCNLSECGERDIAHTVAGLYDPGLRVPELSTMEVEDLERFTGTYYFPALGEVKFVVEDDKLYNQSDWFRYECLMYSPTGCKIEGETRFEFIVNDAGETEGLIYFDSAYDKGWEIERID